MTVAWSLADDDDDDAAPSQRLLRQTQVSPSFAQLVPSV